MEVLQGFKVVVLGKRDWMVSDEHEDKENRGLETRNKTKLFLKRRGWLWR